LVVVGDVVTGGGVGVGVGVVVVVGGGVVVVVVEGGAEVVACAVRVTGPPVQSGHPGPAPGPLLKPYVSVKVYVSPGTRF
jgi:hypothetical protein